MNKFLFACLLPCCLVFAASLPVAAPDQNGFSAERLGKINTAMAKHISDGDLNGASGLIIRNGKVVYRGLGVNTSRTRLCACIR